jgi:uncharacterized membrane protein
METLPNWHPLLVHFPIALYVVAVLVDAVAQGMRSYPWLFRSALLLYVLAAVGALGAYLSGQAAAEGIGPLSGEAYSVLAAHETWALRVLLFLGGYAGLRLLLAFWRPLSGLRWALWVLSLPGWWLLYEAADRGGALVYQHGVGVRTAPVTVDRPFSSQEFAIHPEQGGSWVPGSEAVRLWREHWLTLLSGPWDVDVDSLPAGGLPLRAQRPGAGMWVLEPIWGDGELTVELDRSAFRGALEILHHLQDSSRYDFLRLEADRLLLGRKEPGRVRIWDEAVLASAGDTLRLAVVSTGRHFRGYVGGRMRVHGHADPLPPGRVGLRLEGEGLLRIHRWEVKPVQSPEGL